MQIKTKLIISSSNNPYENLALEEYLFDNVQESEVILYLWQNQHTIVIGKNQNPWKECRVSLAEKDGIFIARRLSGGGAVFHDLGNLNFTFIMKEELYSLEKQLKTIIDAVKRLGINAAFKGKNDIVVKDQKFSGNAFYFSDGKAYHHGTILIDTNMNALGRYLQVTKEKMRSQGIVSIESRVINLVDLNSEITIYKVRQALIESFEQIYGHAVEMIESPKVEVLQDNILKNMSWDWRFGQSPKFDIRFEKRFNFGDIELLFSLKNSKIEKVEIYSDTVMIYILEEIKKILVGVNFDMIHISQKLSDISFKTLEEKDMIGQMRQWIETKVF